MSAEVRGDSDPVQPDAAARPPVPTGPPRYDEPTGQHDDGRSTEQPAEPQPKAERRAEDAWFAGVCSGLAYHLRVPVLAVRLGFVGLTLFQFLGPLIYGVLWLLMPPQADPRQAPGLAANDRAGNRTVVRARRKRDLGAVVALGLFAVGAMWLSQVLGLGYAPQFFWPLAIATAGVALVWRTADPVKKDRGSVRAPTFLQPFVASGRALSVIRVILGIGLVGCAIVWITAAELGVGVVPGVLAVSALALAGVAIIAAPWIHSSRRALIDAREEKVRAELRADMAAHLHDSVLQTLALIQRQAADPKAVQTLARRQERELRTWLYDEETAETTLKAGLQQAGSEVELERGVPVEVVVVGDTDLTEAGQALVRAAREAMVNAAKHSGADKIDVYAEAFDDTIEVFVRDRGCGFDPAAVDEDRLGLKQSITGRMERHGGTARIRSAPGEGTEVRLELKQ
ncbi:PspC domain-containing protein [Naumannella halotolerans]|uniref:PspC domain-containing protein n=1 Tax=Naumannella halotolerans TaxID=993414 RepID=UPI00370D5D2D